MFRLTFTIVALIIISHSSKAELPAEKDVREAVTRSLKRLDTAAANYITHRQCFSCHHQAVPLFAMVAAKRRGFEVSEETLKEQTAFTLKTFQPKIKEIKQGMSIPGNNTTAVYALGTLAALEHTPDDTTEALIEYVLLKQKSDGSWPAVTSRPPTEGSAFTNTAFALETIPRFAPKDPSEEMTKKLDDAKSKAKKWLLANEGKDTEDIVFRLRALVSARVDEADLNRAKDNLLKLQQEDGGWGQLPKKDSDAYATGTALVALAMSGMKPTDEAYQRGIRWLLKNQSEEGAWIVQTRSRPVQVYFDNGDPGGKSQFITISATGWATLALLQTIPEKK
jgi:N-acyl-D-amino-acid deacylase